MSISAKCNLLSTVLVVFATAPAIAQSGISLTQGQLSFTGAFVKQVVSVKNNTGNSFRSVIVECGFYRQGQLIAADTGLLQNLAPGATGFKEVLASANIAADRSECRVSEAR